MQKNKEKHAEVVDKMGSRLQGESQNLSKNIGKTRKRRLTKWDPSTQGIGPSPWVPQIYEMRSKAPAEKMGMCWGN